MTFNNGNQHIYVDSGTTTHMLKNTGKQSFIQPYHGHDQIFIGNGQGLLITHTGHVHINTQNGELILKIVLVVPQLKKNLLSVSQFTFDNPCVF